MNLELSQHARCRMQQRGISSGFLESLLEHADVERPSTDSCRVYRVSKRRARDLGNERLGRFAVIWSDTTGQVVTVLPLKAGRAGASYRRAH